MKFKVVLGFLFLLYAKLSFATCAQTGNELHKLVGLDGDGKSGQIYASLLSSHRQCGCDYVRFHPNNTDVDKVLGILLAAKMAGKAVRVDFIEPNACNSGFRVYVH